MSDTAIRIDGLSKRYVLGAKVDTEGTLRDTISSQARRWLGRGAPQGSASRAPQEFWALRDVSFEVKQGEVVGIIGRNGAGKSTLLKILSRITEPTKGSVTIQGRVSSLLEVGTGFHPELTGRENVFLNGAILGMSRREIQAKFDEIVDFAEVEKFLDTPVKRYSSGMYVRLAFAVAAHLEPEILVVDEVLAVGDLDFQKKCLGKMSSFSKTGRTVIFVSHDLNSVLRLCSTSLLLKAGQVVMKGPSSDVIEVYKAQGHPAKSDKKFGDANFALELNAAQVKAEDDFLIVDCDLSMTSAQAHRSAYYAFDVMDSLGVAIGQAFSVDLGPDAIEAGQQERRRFRLFLPRLIPGSYSLGFWVGPHNTSTIFSVEHLYRFEILESPSKNRTFPHTRDHGNFVPRMELLHVS
jgi:lipopolysaccharide transport system ATP-binding protein